MKEGEMSFTRSADDDRIAFARAETDRRTSS